MVVDSIQNVSIEVGIHYQTTLPPGVYWIGNPENMVDRADWEQALTTSKNFTNPRGVLTNQKRIYGFPTENNENGTFLGSDANPYSATKGLLGVMEAPGSKVRPEGVFAYAFLEPTLFSANDGLLQFGNELTINTRTSQPLGNEVFLNSLRNRKSNFDNLEFDTQLTQFVNLPGGEYWFGDLSYNFDDTTWREVIQTSRGFTNYRATIDGETLFSFPTGVTNTLVEDAAGYQYPLKSGFMGLMEGRKTPSRGGVHTIFFEETARLSWRDGLFSVNGIELNTLPSSQAQNMNPGKRVETLSDEVLETLIVATREPFNALG